MSNNPEKIILHHAADGDVEKGISRDTTKAHIYHVHVVDNGWRYVGYQYIIRMDGSIELGREESARGAHAGPDWNDKSIGICFSGHICIKPPTPEQVETCIELCVDICRRYNLSSSDVIGHNDVSATKCPGTYFPMDTIRQSVHERLNQGIIEDDPIDAEVGKKPEKKIIEDPIKEEETQVEKESPKPVDDVSDSLNKEKVQQQKQNNVNIFTIILEFLAKIFGKR